MADRPADDRFLLLRHPIAVAFAVVVLFGVLRALAHAADILLLGFLAVLVATLVSYPINLFARLVPRPLALAFTAVLMVGIAVGIAWIAIPILTEQARHFVQQVPVALSRLAAWWNEIQRTSVGPHLPTRGPAASITDEATALLGRVVPFAFGVGSVIFTVFVVIALGFVFAYAPASYREGVRTLLPREHEPLLDEAWNRLGVTLRHWIMGITISMLVSGALAMVGLLIAGIEGWFLLGMLTLLGTFVPYVGAIGSAIPGLIVGLAQSPKHFLYALIVYAGVHLAEGYFVSPFVMRYAVHLRPGVLLFWQFLAGALFGLPGVIVATPLLACIKVAVDYFYVERKLHKGPPSTTPEPPSPS